MKEKPWRSVVKAVSWRISSSIGTIIIAFLISGKVTIALSIGFTEVITKTWLYYLHERLWNRISFGKIKEKEPEYMI